MGRKSAGLLTPSGPASTMPIVFLGRLNPVR
jgi:hypothetical protein